MTVNENGRWRQACEIMSLSANVELMFCWRCLNVNLSCTIGSCLVEDPFSSLLRRQWCVLHTTSDIFIIYCWIFSAASFIKWLSHGQHFMSFKAWKISWHRNDSEISFQSVVLAHMIRVYKCLSRVVLRYVYNPFIELQVSSSLAFPRSTTSWMIAYITIICFFLHSFPRMVLFYI